MMAVPERSAVTAPVPLMVATVGVPERQVPPLTVLKNVVVSPGQSNALPVSVPAVAAPMVTVCTAAAVPQTVATVYEISLVPPDRPSTLPNVSTEAIVGLLLLQVPPVPVVARAKLTPAQAPAGPVTVPGTGAGDTPSV